MKEIIKFDSYFIDFTSKKDRRLEYAADFNQDIVNNTKKLLDKVNSLLNDLGIDKVEISSGWRPAQINSKVSNAAKKSYHMNGMAIDLLDNKQQDLGKLMANRPELLKKYDLWIEDLSSTRGQHTTWTHLDIGTRSDRPSRMFKP